jgi:2-C-methyl-D-erythritol 4-phosphate cytidylyltransferase
MVSVVLLAGGSGSRMKYDLPKQFLLLAGKPVIMHTLERLEKIDDIGEIIITCLSSYKNYLIDYIDKYNLKKIYKVIDGGNTRQESVFNGLNNSTNDTIIIHEAARPFVTIEDFRKLLLHSKTNVTFGMDIPFTVLNTEDCKITGVLDRDNLVNIQLPQKFNKILLLNAHKKAIKEGKLFTEDASLLFYYEHSDIAVLDGQDYNIKLTKNFDLIIAEEIYKEYMVVI